MKPPRTAHPNRRTIAQLEALTADLDRELVADEFGPLSPADRRAWARAKRKRPSAQHSGGRRTLIAMTPNKPWAELQRRYPVGLRLQTWSAAKGYLKGSFVIEALSADRIEVNSDGIKNPPRPISRADFERIAALWPEYKAGTLPRSRLIQESQNTTYIVTMLHWLETN
jgi:hypothetical protein